MNLLSCLLLACLWCVVTSDPLYCKVSSMTVEANGNNCYLEHPIGHRVTQELDDCRVSLTCIDGGILACVSKTEFCNVIDSKCSRLVHVTTSIVDRFECMTWSGSNVEGSFNQALD